MKVTRQTFTKWVITPGEEDTRADLEAAVRKLGGTRVKFSSDGLIESTYYGAVETL